MCVQLNSSAGVVSLHELFGYSGRVLEVLGHASMTHLIDKRDNGTGYRWPHDFSSALSSPEVKFLTQSSKQILVVLLYDFKKSRIISFCICICCCSFNPFMISFFSSKILFQNLIR